MLLYSSAERHLLTLLGAHWRGQLQLCQVSLDLQTTAACQMHPFWFSCIKWATE